MESRVAERGQVTIPKKLRTRLGIRQGTVLRFREESGKLVAEKYDRKDPLEALYGLVGDGRRTKTVIDELRGRR